MEDVELIVSTFSVFVNYKSYTDSGSSVSGSVEQKELRFDSKMMHSFSELMNTYKLLRIKFPQYQK